jgi:DNA modification methylase
MSKIMYKYLPVSVFDVNKIGKIGIRGKQNHSGQSSRSSYSPFSPQIAEWCMEYFLRNTSTLFDPFAGWGERHVAAKNFDKVYLGYDISPDAIEFAKKHYNVDNILANSLTEEIPYHDGLITCPPYWNLEKYGSKNGLDRLKDWKDFLNQYGEVLKRVSEKALPGAKYCIIVGDWRMKKKFYDFTYQTEKIMEKCGMVPFDKVILSQKKISPIKLQMPQAKRLGYTVKVHQTLLVYEKV